MESLRTHDDLDLVELPRDRKAVGSKWIYKLKKNADGSIEQYKARLRSLELIMIRHFVQLSALNQLEQSSR